MAFSLNDTNNLFSFLQVFNSSNSFETAVNEQHALTSQPTTVHELLEDTNMFDDFFLTEDETLPNSANQVSTSYSAPTSLKEMSSTKPQTKKEQLNTDYMYGVIDHVLQDTKSDIGLKWSMLECSSQIIVDSSIQSPVSNNTEATTLSNSAPASPKEYHQHGRARSGSSNTNSNTTCNTITSNQSQDFEFPQTFNMSFNVNSVLENNQSSMQNTCIQSNSSNHQNSSPICVRKIKKNPKRKKSIQFISEEGSSYPLQLESFNCSVLSSTPLKRGNNNSISVKSNNKRKAMSHLQPFQKTAPHENSYKIRFSHNVFEEITFKNTNPSQKFYKFNGIGEDQINN